MWRWAIAACLSLLATVAVGAPADADSPLRLLERMSTALATKNYDGEFLRMADGRVDRFRIVHRREAQGYTERVQLLVGAGRIGREIIRKNNELRRYIPETRQVFVGPAGMGDGTLLGYLPVFGTSADQPYQLVAEGRQTTTTGRPARVIQVRARDEFRLGYRLWIDESTGMPTRTDLLDPRGRILEQLVFTELRLRSRIADEELQPSPLVRGYARVEAGAEPLPTRVAPLTSPWQVAHLPPGFRVAQRTVKWLPGSGTPATHLVVTDGVASVSVFVEQPSPGRVPRVGSGRIGAASAYTTVVEGHQVTAVGEVPPRTVEAIARQVVPH
ncbi:MAG: MucB/RseB C-terminal domain-containing protein [Gammaproteobacteria bacterium]